MTPFENTAVERAFAAYPPAMRRKLLALRELIFSTAAATEGVGPLHETLNWGEPAYVTAQTRSGSTVRLGWKRSTPSQYAMYFHCQTRLVETFQTLFPSELRFEGNRAIVFGETRRGADRRAVAVHRGRADLPPPARALAAARLPRSVGPARRHHTAAVRTVTSVLLRCTVSRQ